MKKFYAAISTRGGGNPIPAVARIGSASRRGQAKHRVIAVTGHAARMGVGAAFLKRAPSPHLACAGQVDLLAELGIGMHASNDSAGQGGKAEGFCSSAVFGSSISLCRPAVVLWAECAQPTRKPGAILLDAAGAWVCRESALLDASGRWGALSFGGGRSHFFLERRTAAARSGVDSGDQAEARAAAEGLATRRRGWRRSQVRERQSHSTGPK